MFAKTACHVSTGVCEKNAFDFLCCSSEIVLNIGWKWKARFSSLRVTSVKKFFDENNLLRKKQSFCKYFMFCLSDYWQKISACLPKLHSTCLQEFVKKNIFDFLCSSSEIVLNIRWKSKARFLSLRVTSVKNFLLKRICSEKKQSFCKYFMFSGKTLSEFWRNLLHSFDKSAL